jgi:hypothetical protein
MAVFLVTAVNAKRPASYGVIAGSATEAREHVSRCGQE